MVPEWLGPFLECPACRLPLTQAGASLQCPGCRVPYPFRDGILVCPGLARDATFQFYEPGTQLRERAKVALSTSHFEDKVYRRLLEKHLAPAPTDRVLELGCGDGRMTDHLLRLGARRIVAVDISLEGMRRYRDALAPEDRSRVFFIQSDVHHLPLAPEAMDQVVAIEVLLYLNDRFENSLKVVHGLTRPGGRFVHSEPTLSGGLLFHLVSADFERMRAMLATHRKTEQFLGGTTTSRVFPPGEIEACLARAGFRVDQVEGIPAFASLMIRALAQGGPGPGEAWVDLIEALMAQGLPPFRIQLYAATKAAQAG